MLVSLTDTICLDLHFVYSQPAQPANKRALRLLGSGLRRQAYYININLPSWYQWGICVTYNFWMHAAWWSLTGHCGLFTWFPLYPLGDGESGVAISGRWLCLPVESISLRGVVKKQEAEGINMMVQIWWYKYDGANMMVQIWWYKHEVTM